METRVAVVTGGNRGVGLEICRQLASNGILVVLTARDEEKGCQAVKALHQSGLSGVTFHQLDVIDRSSILLLVEFVRTKFGKLDILVNNAAIGGTTIDPERLSELLKQDPKASSQLDYFPQFISNEGVIKVLSDIDNLSDEKLKDVSGMFLKDFKDGNLEANGWQPVTSAYAVSKTLVNAYSRLLAKKHPLLEVCCVNPGFVKTDMNYGMGLISAEEGAKAPVRLALQELRGHSCLYFEQCEIAEF
ncbi:(+)-neomenthol dehydrogenase-like [Oryza brachyantha]|uniref:(+)-neomenthol dehydrogenase-like n=1 Tax=Oryza brachyantha TaxID=4533 RepID=UPI0003EA8D85|nr:(+)-neomenthol dehydrogenase-like [Oryza brachyantha]